MARHGGRGLRDGGQTTPTIVCRSQGGTQSSSFLPRKPALAFHQRNAKRAWRWSRCTRVGEDLHADYAMSPAKPTLDLEPNYEDHPYNPWPRWDPATGYFQDHDVRKQVYRSVFAGASESPPGIMRFGSLPTSGKR